MSTAEPETDRPRLRRIAVIAEWTALAGAATVAAFVAYLWLTPGAWLTYLAKDVPNAPSRLDAGVETLAGLIGTTPALIFVLAMWEARGLFRELRFGTLFGQTVTRHLLRLGWLALVAALGGVVVRLLVGLVLTWDNPEGQRQLILAIGTNEITAMIAGLLFLAFALVVNEARRLEDDSRSIV